MKLGKRGEELIKSYEQLRLKAYLPTPADVWTIGWGHTKGVKEGDTCTIEEAQRFFEEDTASAVATVNALQLPLTQAMFDALVSLVFNAGPEAIGLTATIGKAFRLHRWAEAWAGFTLWRKQGGKDLLGLMRRRSEEMVLFLNDGLPK